MKRFILLGFAVYCSSAATTIADDFMLRVDTIGYVDQPASKRNPKETILRSIEVIARPELPFHNKVVIGKQILSLDGELRRADNGGFAAHVRYVNLVDSGNIGASKEGAWITVLDEESIETTVAISVGERVLIGGMDTQSSDFGKPDRKSRARCVLVLTKYKPTDD